jgi:hypothetical protein
MITTLNAHGRFIMKKLTAIVLAILLSFWMFSVPVIADPGDESEPDGTGAPATNPEYPPPPPDYEGLWPPEWMMGSDGSGGGTPPPTGDSGDDGSWGDPNE